MGEYFTYRSLLELTQFAAMLAAGAAFFSSMLWFLRPQWEGRASTSGVVATAGGGEIPVRIPRPQGGPDLVLGLSRLLPVFVGVCFLLNLVAQTTRYFEVMHWPAQTMYEVVPLGTTMGCLSILILYFVLGIPALRGSARGFGDLFVCTVLIGIYFVLAKVLDMDPTGRALPPALQSYWFSTHITAYMFSYFTLFIATAAAWLFFCFRFWRSLLDKASHPMNPIVFWGVIAFSLSAIPFGNGGLMLGPGILGGCGIIAAVSMTSARKMEWLNVWERGGDRFTWLIFVVGFPFLTAGLIQGGLWAQEAWALYWGWDSKEVSALISWIFYVVYLHLRYVAGWRGEKGMWILAFGGLSIYITFQLFGFLPASQASLHKYTDMSTVPAEGMLDPDPGPSR